MIMVIFYEVEIYLEDCCYEVVGQYVMENQIEVLLDMFWLFYGVGMIVVCYEMDGVMLDVIDEGMYIYFFMLELLMQLGEVCMLDFEVYCNNFGFCNSGNVMMVNYNGIFFNNGEFMLQIGVNQGWFLQD